MSNRQLTQLQRDLVAVARVLEERGWCCGKFENDRGNVCIGKAVSIAIGHNSEARHAVVRALIGVIGGDSIIRWNDQICPSGKVAIATIYHAAELEQL